MSHSSQVDQYIQNAQDFAKPILEHIRTLIHEVVPEVEETIKWGFPHFIYHGKNLCAMSAFKKHAAFGFWLEIEMKTMKPLIEEREKNSMFRLGKLTKVEDLPTRLILIEAIKEAMQLTDLGVTLKKAAPNKTEVVIPDDFLLLLEANAVAKTQFEKLSRSGKREYVDWINDAKTESTRHKRLQTSLEWIAEGKDRNWKYKK